MPSLLFFVTEKEDNAPLLKEVAKYVQYCIYKGDQCLPYAVFFTQEQGNSHPLKDKADRAQYCFYMRGSVPSVF